MEPLLPHLAVLLEQEGEGIEITDNGQRSKDNGQRSKDYGQ